MQVTEITNYNLKSQTILNESWDILTEAQRIHIGHWEKDLWPLMESYNKLLEAELTPKQIDAIFTSAEQTAMAGGGNKTVLGKAGGSIAKQTAKITDTLNKLATQAQNSGPIKNFDAQFEKLKLQLKKQLQGNPVGQKVLKGIESWGDFAKESPAKSAFIIGAMTSLLAFASGGILSGAAIGFFIKMANNTMKGDKLSTAVGKGVKGAAIGAVAGALGDAISNTADDLFPPEVTQVFMNQDGMIDISELDAMTATAETVTAEQAKELVQTFNAMGEMAKNLDNEELEVLNQQLEQVRAKIFDLSPMDGGSLGDNMDALQDKFGIEGRGVDVKVTGNTVDVTTDAEPLPGDDGDYGEAPPDAEPDADKLSGDEVGTVKAQYSAEELNDKFNIDSSEFPRNAWMDENKDALLKAGMTETEFEDLQSATQLQRAIDQANWREGINISASNESTMFMGDTPKIIDGIEGEYQAGDTFTSEIQTKLPGSDKPWSANVSVSIEGVDANGDAVYAIKELTVQPEVFNDKMFAAIDALAEQDPENPLVKEFMDKVIMSNQSASLETLKDTFAQDVAEKVMQGAAAVALGGALAQTEVKPAQGELDLKGGQGVKNTESIDYTEAYTYLFEQYVSEAPPAQGELPLDNPNSMANKLKKGALGAGSSLLKTVNKGIDAVGKAASTGIQKGVAGVKDAGKQLANKVTKEKLMKAWKTAGSPTDTGSIINILSDNGLADDQIMSIGQSNKVDLKPTTQSADEKPADDAPVDANNDGKDDATGDPMPVDANNDGKDDATGDPMPKPKDTSQTGSTSTAKPNPKIKVAPGAGQMAKAKDGQDYIWAGAQWINNSTAKMATKGVAAELGNPVLTGLADEIKKAGVQAEVKAMLTGAKAPPSGKPAPKV